MNATLHASQSGQAPNDYDSHNDGEGPPPGGRGRMLRWFLVVFLIFAVLGIYSLTQRRTEHKVLAEQTEHMAVPYVSVIHASAVTGESELVLPGNINSYVNAPIYARTNG